MADWDGSGYERISGLQRQLAEEVLSRLAFRGDERVLDVGCGDGFITRAIGARLPRGSVLGVDASPRMIDAARAASSSPPAPAGRVEFAQADVRELTFLAEFDVVVSFNALHWVSDQVAALTPVARATRPGGTVVIQQVCAGARPSLEAVAMRVSGTRRWAGFFAGFDPPYVHVDPAAYPSIAGDAGLRLTDLLVRDVEWDFGSRDAFVDWCTVGFADWTARLPSSDLGEWVDAVVAAYQVVAGAAGLFRFMQLRAELTPAPAE